MYELFEEINKYLSENPKIILVAVQFCTKKIKEYVSEDVAKVDA